ncbi:methylase involved in ubiquinone/menaquinone biosynthesis [Gottschalkia purinilytica]|uniref:Methylase involved in ubiquinone/menaquinone biosynthesis n=1 Tax=Gottschalkia purinilytica TaxID=1503 RepID=A0A0L0WCS7_GOTPU|nr:class I SAM-dependent methyltransferase [Gottschalkia purinilytica]KNF09284.1 methylase involved in ubiquinone/menaquinone biosynthesis [Gottschalkia purinilytica]
MENIDEKLKDRIFSTNLQVVNLDKVSFRGKILDIGGGGEGVIGQVYGDQVISIDSLEEELREAPEGPLKIIMDAKNLTFLDNSFDLVTSFFTMMYIEYEHREKVIEEVYRVLNPGGKFKLWDINVTKPNDCKKDVYLVPVEINIGERKINTSYGVSWKNREQSILYYIDIFKKVGFEILNKNTNGQVYHLVGKKS